MPGRMQRQPFTLPKSSSNILQHKSNYSAELWRQEESKRATKMFITVYNEKEARFKQQHVVPLTKPDTVCEGITKVNLLYHWSIQAVQSAVEPHALKKEKQTILSVFSLSKKCCLATASKTWTLMSLPSQNYLLINCFPKQILYPLLNNSYFPASRN